MHLTKNFEYEEFVNSRVADKLGIRNVPNSGKKNNNIAALARLLQTIRDKYGKPIHISSGYRCEELNDAVKGVKTSDHLNGNAADIYSENTKELFLLIKSMIENKEISVCQLINEYNYRWIHISREYDGCKHHNHIFSKNSI